MPTAGSWGLRLRHGRPPMTPPRSDGMNWAAVPRGARRCTGAHGPPLHPGSRDGSALLVGLQIHGGPGGAVVAYAFRPDLSEHLGIVRHEFLQSALLAFAVGAALGLLIASLIARRLARIARRRARDRRGRLQRPDPRPLPGRGRQPRRSIERMRASSRISSARSRRTATGSSGCSTASTTACCSRPRAPRRVRERPRARAARHRRASRRSPISPDGPGGAAAARGRPLLDGAAGPPPADVDERTLLVSGIPPSAGGENAISSSSTSRARAQRARPAGVRDERRARAAHAARVHRHRRRDAADRRQGRAGRRATRSST